VVSPGSTGEGRNPHVARGMGLNIDPLRWPPGANLISPDISLSPEVQVVHVGQVSLSVRGNRYIMRFPHRSHSSDEEMRAVANIMKFEIPHGYKLICSRTGMEGTTWATYGLP
jgi:hypothetical protein